MICRVQEDFPNGSEVLAYEMRNGLEAPGVLHQLTLAYSLYQKGKQESFWGVWKVD